MDESILYRLQHCLDRPEYLEGYWSPKETCNHSDFSERPSANDGVQKTRMSIIIITMIILNVSIQILYKMVVSVERNFTLLQIQKHKATSGTSIQTTVM